MEISSYPKYTIILRGSTLQQAELIASSLLPYANEFAIEVTLNTNHAFDIIEILNKNYSNHLNIGAGTVRTAWEAKEAISRGAKFLLGPHKFSQEVFEIASRNEVLTIPAAMTPSEIIDMLEKGADIVKVFPATVVSPRFFKDIQAPLGKLPLMAVGGINKNNAKDFLNHGASYVGIGSGMFNSHDLDTLNASNIEQSISNFMNTVSA